MFLPDALVHRPYGPEAAWERVSTRCGMPVAAVRVVDGALPPGLQLTARGTMEGTPTDVGEYRFTVEISDGCSRRREERSIRVIPAPMLIAEAERQRFRCLRSAPSFDGGLVRVSGSAPGHAYRIDVLPADDGKVPEWLEARARGGVLPAGGMAFEADAVRLTVHPEKLAPGTYRAALRFSTWQGANAPVVPFTLQVDSAQSVLVPGPPLPAPVPVRIEIQEAPGVQQVQPPRVETPAAPVFPKYKPRPHRTGPASGLGRRSRVLPFPKVTIPDRPPQKKEDAPHRTKPSAMPPAEAHKTAH